MLPWDPIQAGAPSMPPRAWDPRLETQAPCVPFRLAPYSQPDSRPQRLPTSASLRQGPPSRLSPTFHKAAPPPRLNFPLKRLSLPYLGLGTPPQHSSVGWISPPPTLEYSRWFWNLREVGIPPLATSALRDPPKAVNCILPALCGSSGLFRSHLSLELCLLWLCPHPRSDLIPSP